MRVLVVGSGAREHALAWRLELDGADVTVAPGNGGTRQRANIDVLDFGGLALFARESNVDLTIVGPEVPLAAGIVDRLESEGLKVFGPSQAAARLESSKSWAKGFFIRHGIPTGRAATVTTEAAALEEIERVGLPVAIKADGLAAGKGVHVAHRPEDVDFAIDQLFHKKAVGSASETVLIEEFLDGEELSVLAFTDGERLAIMPPARDYKRLLDGDRGPNTGGLGGYTWPAYATPPLLEEVEQRVLRPTIDGMAREGTPYRGVLYAGLMITRDGPKVFEFNCRFGDPETQLIVPLLDCSLADVCQSVADGRLDPPAVRWKDGRTYGVVLASAGYPDAPRLGDAVSSLDAVPEGVQVFHAGTAERNGVVVTSGGRVLTLVSESREQVYAAAECVRFDGKQYRRDIAAEAAVLAGR